jgi:alanine dehydrogenase
MIVGVPYEEHGQEHRVGLSPFAVARLAQLGHTVLVERNAGDAAHFRDAHYQDAGAKIVYSCEEVLRRSDLVCCVARLTPEQTVMLQRGSTVLGFQHLAVAPESQIQSLHERGATLIGYEIIEDASGDLPVLSPFTEMAGHMVLQIAARYLQAEEGGRGILLGSIPCVAPPTVLILGAGRVGHAVAQHAIDAGAHTIVIDSDVTKLRHLHEASSGRVVTVVAGDDRLEKYTAIADVVVGAVLIPGGRAPFVVSEDMVKGMKQGSVIIDVSIDQGGCVETSRPTTISDPVFSAHGVTHYCVPNMTANVPRTASRALSSAALKYVVEIAEKGIDGALRADRGLARGAYFYRGNLVQERIGDLLGLSVTPIEQLLGEERA